MRRRKRPRRPLGTREERPRYADQRRDVSETPDEKQAPPAVTVNQRDAEQREYQIHDAERHRGAQHGVRRDARLREDPRGVVQDEVDTRCLIEEGDQEGQEDRKTVAARKERREPNFAAGGRLANRRDQPIRILTRIQSQQNLARRVLILPARDQPSWTLRYTHH